jgi:hypothetical protein
MNQPLGFDKEAIVNVPFRPDSTGGKLTDYLKQQLLSNGVQAVSFCSNTPVEDDNNMFTTFKFDNAIKDEDFQAIVKFADNDYVPTYKLQLIEIAQSFGAMLRRLPSRTEIPGLLEDVSKTGIAAGTEKKEQETQKTAEEMLSDPMSAKEDKSTKIITNIQELLKSSEKEAETLPAGIIVIGGDLNGTLFDILEGNDTIVGRNVDNQIQLDFEGISRRHCKFAWEGEKTFIEDLGSIRKIGNSARQCLKGPFSILN